MIRILIKLYNIIAIKKLLCKYLHQTSKKLALILAFFMLVIDVNNIKSVVKKVSYINYSIRFEKNQNKIRVLSNSRSKIIVMNFNNA